MVSFIYLFIYVPNSIFMLFYISLSIYVCIYFLEKPLSQWFNPPASSFFASTVEQLQSRFPTFKEEQIKELIEDYKKENTALQHSIQEYQLNTHVEHALRLLNLKSSL